MISSVHSLDRFGWGVGHDRQFCRDILSVFSTGGHYEQFCHGQGYPSFDVVHPAFPLPTMGWFTLQGAFKDGFREAVMVRDMSEPYKFPSLDSRQKNFISWVLCF